MEWLPIATITTSSNYNFTPVVSGSLFKLKHFSQSLKRTSLKIAVRQAFNDDDSLALFDYKLINCKVEQDIILFSLPQGLTGRRLAIKRVDNYLDESWSIEIESLEIAEDGVNLPITISDVADLQQRLDAIQAELTLKALNVDLDTHIVNTNNPHNTTALQVGADPVGSATNEVALHENTTNHPLVSLNNKGMMAAIDKAKLDTIEAYATANLPNLHLLNRGNHEGKQPIASITGLEAILNTFVTLTSNQNISGNKAFTNLLTVSNLNYKNTPLNVEFRRPVSMTVNEFIELGYFDIPNGATTFRMTLVISDPSFSLAKIYTLSTMFSPTETAWRRILPGRQSVYTAANNCEIDIKSAFDRTYLRIRRAGSSTPQGGTAIIRLEFTGSSDTTFVETNGTGVDASVTATY